MHNRISETAFIGVGGCGINMLKSWAPHLPQKVCRIAINRDKQSLHMVSNMTRLLLNRDCIVNGEEKSFTPTGEKQIQTCMQQQMSELTDLLEGRSSIILLAGLGGDTGTWASQIICNHLLSIGKQVVTVLVMPFSFERKRVKLAEESLAGFDGSAHRVLCYNDFLIRHSPKGYSFNESLEFMNEQAFDLLSFPGCKQFESQ